MTGPDEMTEEELKQAAELMVQLRKASGHRFPREGSGQPLRLTMSDIEDAMTAIEAAWPVLRDAAAALDGIETIPPASGEIGDQE